MTNMENMDKQLAEYQRLDAVYEDAMARIAADRAAQDKAGYLVMASAMGYGESATGNGIFGKISHAAMLFCILFAMLVPSLLIWGYVL